MKKLRMRRLIRHSSGRMIFLPVDHGVTVGPIQGIEDLQVFLKQVVNLNVDGIILHKGQVRSCRELFFKDPHLNVVMHLSASVHISPTANHKVLVASVEEAARLGADAVSVHVNLGSDKDSEMLADLGRVSDSCHQWDMPLIAMMYCRGKSVGDEYDWQTNALAARVAMELGADIVKINYTGSPESFRRVLRGISIPVVIAGGPPKGSLRDTLMDVQGALQAGAAGVAIGRSFFQFARPSAFAKALDLLVHQSVTLEEALLATSDSHCFPISQKEYCV